MNKQLILLEKKVAFSKLPSIIKNDDLCYLLSKDYISYLRLNEIVPNGCKVLNLAGRSNREIKRLQKGYLNLFADLSKKHNSLHWWCSHLASRSSSSIPLQLNVAYLSCIKTLISSVNKENKFKRLIFICDSDALIDCITTLGKEKIFRVIIYKNRFKKVIKTILRYPFYFLKIIIFLLISLKNRIIATSLLNPISFNQLKSRKVVVIRSWITKGTLNESGSFSDRNFGNLPLWLKTKKYHVIMLPMIFNYDKSMNNLYKLMKRQDVDFLIQDFYLKIIDYFKIIQVAWKQNKVPINNITLDGMDVTPLFHEIQVLEGFNIKNLTHNLCYFLMERLKKQKVQIDTFYYPFENNVVEKPFILGCKNSFPTADVIAFQHTVWYKNQLGMFLGNNESKYHPIADKIIYTGPIYFQVLQDAGFPRSKLISGPSLRFKYLEKKNDKKTDQLRKPNIFIALTFDDNLAYDIISKAKTISEIFPQISIFIRRHPALNYKALEKYLLSIEFDNFRYADTGRIQDWLINTDVVLSNGYSVIILETVMMNVPIIRIIPDNDLFLDPLAWIDYPIPYVNSINDIKKQLDNIFKIKEEGRTVFNELSQVVSKQYFTNYSEKNMEVFH